MYGHARVIDRVVLVFVLMLLPGVAVFWYFMSGVFHRSSMAEAEHSLAAVMNQADRLTFDLDLELSFMDAYLARGLAGQAANGTAARTIRITGTDQNTGHSPRDINPLAGIPAETTGGQTLAALLRSSLSLDDGLVRRALTAYRTESRWPNLVKALYLVETAIARTTEVPAPQAAAAENPAETSTTGSLGETGQMAADRSVANQTTARRVAPALPEGQQDPYLDKVVAYYAGKPDSSHDDFLLTRVVGFRTDQHDQHEPTARALVTILDTEVFFGIVMPALVDAYFSEAADFPGFDIAVRDPAGQLRFSTVDGKLDGATGDVTSPIDADRPGGAGSTVSTARTAGAIPGRTVTRQPDFVRPMLRETGRFDVARFYAMYTVRPNGFTVTIPGLGALGLGSIIRNARENDTEWQMRRDSASNFPIDRYRFQTLDSPDFWTLEISRRGLSIRDSALRNARRWSLGTAAFMVLLYGSIVAMYTAALRSARLADRERSFVASVTHELKTPIAVALSAGENLQKGIVPADRVVDYGAIVARESRRLSEAVERLLLMAGLESAHSFRRGEVVPLMEATSAVLARLSRYMVERNAVVDVSVADTPVADGSRALIEAAMECIIGNAIKYAGGTIHVQLFEVAGRGRRLAGMRCIDSGPGVPRPERKRIFEPFFRGSAADSIPGTGVGLYLAKRSARLHGGDVRLSFPADGGLTAEITFRSYI
jgi:signal transduction histidine kinase